MRFRTSKVKSNFRCGFYFSPKSPKKHNKIPAFFLVLRKIAQGQPKNSELNSSVETQNQLHFEFFFTPSQSAFDRNTIVTATQRAKPPSKQKNHHTEMQCLDPVYFSIERKSSGGIQSCRAPWKSTCKLAKVQLRNVKQLIRFKSQNPTQLSQMAQCFQLRTVSVAYMAF